jgi:hypothetical protein
MMTMRWFDRVIRVVVQSSILCIDAQPLNAAYTLNLGPESQDADIWTGLRVRPTGLFAEVGAAGACQWVWL